MTIRLRTTIRTKTVIDVADAMLAYPEFLERQFVETEQDIAPPLIQFLSQSPGPVVYPVKWTSAKQEGEYYRTKGFERGIPTTRTGAILRGWQSRIEKRSDGRDVWVFENIHPRSKFPFGKLNKRLSDAARPQQRFHRNTGYPLAAEYTNVAAEDFRDEYRKRVLPKSTADFVRRASTTRGKV
jgi:hypothetical protein